MEEGLRKGERRAGRRERDKYVETIGRVEMGREEVEIKEGKEMREEGKRRTRGKRERQRYTGSC